MALSGRLGGHNRLSQLGDRGRAGPSFRQAHDVLTGCVKRGVLPGAVSLICWRDEISVDAVGSIAFGARSVMRRDTIFRIASMTKAITAAAVMILVDDGKIQLDEPVDRLLPEIASRRVLRRIDGPLDDTIAANRPVTVRDLLDFSWGFGLLFPPDVLPIQKAASALGLNQMPTPPVMTPNEWMRRLGTLPLMYQPGERWLYHTGADVLGVLVARASLQPFDSFLRERLLKPLGMHDTDFSVPASKVDRLPPVYVQTPGTKTLTINDAMGADVMIHAPAFPSGAGGLVSTVDDYLAFARMLHARGVSGRERILSARSVELMTSDHLTGTLRAKSGLYPGFFANRGWGFGMTVVDRPDEISSAPGRYGWDGIFGTSWYNDPTRDLVVILMTQRTMDEASPAAAFFKAVYRSVNR
jgi:CubicO group peptidase (beta-lactamase class C family)